MIDEQNNDTKGFDMSPNLAHNIYAQNNIGVESPEKLIAMLYEGVLRFNAQAKKAIKDANTEKKFYWTNRSIAVIVELISVLDTKQKGTIVAYLSGVYNYQIQLLSRALVENDTSKIDECNNVFKALLEAWRESTNVA
jgi:flagellar protein FliS